MAALFYWCRKKDELAFVEHKTEEIEMQDASEPFQGMPMPDAVKAVADAMQNIDNPSYSADWNEASGFGGFMDDADTYGER